MFASVGAGCAFEATLGEASEMYGWRIHAHVVMRNHFPLLGVGNPATEFGPGHALAGEHIRHSLQSVPFRTRACVSQGRYQAPVVEEAAATFSWIARKLNLGNLNTLRSNVRRWQRLHRALA